MRTRLAVWLVAALLLALLLVPVAVRAQPPAPLEGTLFTNTLLWSTTPGAQVSFVLRNAERIKATANATADANGLVTATFRASGMQSDNTIRAGDQIGVHPTAADAYTRTVVAISTDIDPAARKVSGVGPSNVPIAATVRREDGTLTYETTVDSDADGNYAADIPAQVEIASGTNGTVRPVLLGGDMFSARWDVLTAQVTIGSASISGRATLGSAVRATLQVDSTEKATTGADPTTILRTPTYSLTFRQNSQSQAVAAGDVVSLVYSDTEKLRGTVPQITVQVDPATDVVSGMAPPGSTVVVSTTVPGQGTVNVSATTDESGHYAADFSGQADLAPGSTAYTAYEHDYITYRAVGAAEQVRANLYSSQLAGSAAPGTPITASLFDDGTEIAAATGTTGGGGTFQLTLTQSGTSTAVRAVPGNRLQVTLGASSATGLQRAPGGATAGMAGVVEIVLPDLTADADSDADTVSGRALPDAPVTVTVSGTGGGASHSVETTADTDGAYRADFAGIADIEPGTTGTLTVELAGGHTVGMAWALPRVAVTLDSDVVTGIGPAGRTVTARLSRGGLGIGEGSAEVGAGGGLGGGSSWSVALRQGGAGGDPVPVRAMDELEIEVASWTIDLVVPEVTVDATAVSSIARGLAPAGREVRVTASRGGAYRSMTVTAGADGRYEADFAADWQFSIGDRIGATVTLDGGHTVTAESIVPGITVFLETGMVSGTGPRDSDVAATLRDADAALRATGQATTDANGAFQLQLVDPAGDAVPMRTDDVLTVDYGASSLTVTIPKLTVAGDAATDGVSGTATPGGQVAVTAIDAYGYNTASLSATPAADGSWAMDFAGTMDIRAGTVLQTTYRMADGNLARIDRVMPIAHLQLEGNVVNGYAAPGAHVDVHLERAAATIATVSSESDLAGAFAVWLRTGTMQPVAIRAGDRVIVQWQGGTLMSPSAVGEIDTVAASLTGTISASSRTVAGTALPGDTLYLTLSFGPSGTFNLPISADAGGAYSQVLGGFQSLTAGYLVEVGRLDDAGHRTYLPLVVPYLELVMGSSQVSGHVAPLAPLALRLSNGAGELGQADLTAGEGGPANISLAAFDATLDPTGPSPVEIQTGQQLTLAEPRSGTTTVDVPVLTIVLDTVGHAIHGTAPPNTAVPLRLYPPGTEPVDTQTQSDANGAWAIDDTDLPTGATYTIADLERSDARLIVGNGHRVIALAVPSAQPTPGPGTPTATVTPTLGPGTTATVTPTATASEVTATPTSPGGERSIYMPWGRK